VAEGQILEDQILVATADHGDRPQEQQCQFKHVLILSGVAAESNTGSAMTTFWRTTGEPQASIRIAHSAIPTQRGPRPTLQEGARPSAL